MNYLEVSPYGVVGKDFLVLTYASAATLPAGAVVEIPVGQRKFVGVVLRTVPKPQFECKEILRVLTDRPLPPALLALQQWLSQYYLTHPSTVWQTILPAGLNKSRRTQSPATSAARTVLAANKQKGLCCKDRPCSKELTFDQQTAISQILKMKSGTALLHGITGSGKTEVYKALAMQAAARGKSSIILVPEISLTAQLVAEFKKDFSHVIVTHSKQTEAERHLIWLEALNADQPVVVIGPRSALFMPVNNLGFIAIDECHEPSYKQEKAPRYSALRAASVLAEKSGARLVLGSATPLIADYFTAQKLGRPIIKMNQLARPDAVKPKTTVIDMTRSSAGSKNPIFSKPLLEAMEKTLVNNKQILIFHNRRGSAPVTLCENCGWTAFCPRCFVPLTLHVDKHQLKCHICGHHEPPPTSCPVCREANIIHKGLGTKMIESEIRKLFPDATVRRFDGDNPSGEGVHDMYDELKSGKINIIIGTQTIAKGLDLPNLTLVGIPQADAGLMLPDFSSSERTFQLIAQAAGRVGRNKAASQVIIQTYQPKHPAVVCGSTQNYKAFYDFEIKNRQKNHFPPFAHLLKLTNSYKTEKSAINSARKLALLIANDSQLAKIHILGPTPAFYERQRDLWRWQIIVRAAKRADLVKVAGLIPPQHWQSELDPNS
ncbi:MAG: primosomal protein N', partial [Candidatus Nomurabacteria bacterium]|nr:primosomal protein N' [Candidatus Nomurabacteria bacterium]